MINIETDYKDVFLKIYDAIITFSTNSKELLNEIRKDFGQFEINKIPDTIDGTIRIAQIENKFPLEIPEYAIRESFLPPNSFIFNKSNLKFLEEKGERILRVDYEKNDIFGYFKSPIKYSTFLRFLLKWMLIKSLEKKGITFIHGSGVEGDGKSFFFTGPSHFGKTHTLITFLLNGYKIITDDTILFKDDRVLPICLRSTIHLNTFKQFPILEKGLNEKNTLVPETGWLMDLKTIFPFQESEVPVKGSKIFYVNIWNASETKVEPMQKKEMLARLIHGYRIEWEHSLYYNPDKNEVMRKLFQNYDAFIEKADCFNVLAGNDNSIFFKTIQAV